ncbi:hypothetical protein OF83DRAFT_1178532 [Amylostereum chailletii]|nr:hypothetical protein OF83DRAFT_1178532 [Amylostereum chailletii]
MPPIHVSCVSLPACKPYLPELLLCLDAHPGHPSGLPVGNTYVFEQDVSKAALKHLDNKALKQEVPKMTSAKDLEEDLGFLELKAGDAIFARKKGDPDDGSLDVLQALVLKRVHFTKPVQNDTNDDATLPALEDIDGYDSDNSLPPIEAVDALVAYRIVELGVQGKVYQGGTAFERSGHAYPVADSMRAYGIATSFERTTQLISPAKGNKVSPGNENLRGLDMRRDVLQCGMSVRVTASRYLPKEFRTHMRLNADLVNAPSIGTGDNVFWTNA